MKTNLAILGAALCLAGTSQAILWTGEIYFTTTHVDWDSAGPEEIWPGGIPSFGETELAWIYVFDSEGETPDGFYANHLGDGPANHAFGIYRPGTDPRLVVLPDGPFQLFNEGFHLDANVNEGGITHFFSYLKPLEFRLSEGENYWVDDYWAGPVTITDPLLVHPSPQLLVAPVPDSGSTLPLVSAAMVGILLYRRLTIS